MNPYPQQPPPRQYQQPGPPQPGYGQPPPQGQWQYQQPPPAQGQPPYAGSPPHGQQPQQAPPPTGGRASKATCYNCGQNGHWALACPNPIRPISQRRSQPTRGKQRKPGGPVVTRYGAPPTQASPPRNNSYSQPGQAPPPYPPQQSPTHASGPAPAPAPYGAPPPAGQPPYGYQPQQPYQYPPQSAPGPYQQPPQAPPQGPPANGWSAPPPQGYYPPPAPYHQPGGPPQPPYQAPYPQAPPPHYPPQGGPQGGAPDPYGYAPQAQPAPYGQPHYPPYQQGPPPPGPPDQGYNGQYYPPPQNGGYQQSPPAPYDGPPRHDSYDHAQQQSEPANAQAEHTEEESKTARRPSNQWQEDIDGLDFPDPEAIMNGKVIDPAAHPLPSTPPTSDEPEPIPKAVDGVSNIPVSRYIKDGDQEAFLKNVKEKEELWKELQGDPAFSPIAGDSSSLSLEELRERRRQMLSKKPTEAAMKAKQEPEGLSPGYVPEDDLEPGQYEEAQTSAPTSAYPEETEAERLAREQEERLAALGVSGAPKPADDGPANPKIRKVSKGRFAHNSNYADNDNPNPYPYERRHNGAGRGGRGGSRKSSFYNDRKKFKNGHRQNSGNWNGAPPPPPEAPYSGPPQQQHWQSVPPPQQGYPPQQASPAWHTHSDYQSGAPAEGFAQPAAPDYGPSENYDPWQPGSRTPTWHGHHADTDDANQRPNDRKRSRAETEDGEVAPRRQGGDGGPKYKRRSQQHVDEAYSRRW